MAMVEKKCPMPDRPITCRQRRVRAMVEVWDNGWIYPTGSEFWMWEHQVPGHVAAGQVKDLGVVLADDGPPAAPRKIGITSH